MEKKPTVCITGATSGIGKATAGLLAQKGFPLIICGRRQQRLEELQEQLRPLTAVHTLNFDVSNKAAVFAAIESLPEPFLEIGVLINNAGNAHGSAPIDQGNLEDWETMLDSNVKGLLYVSKAIVPQMVVRQSGHIINIGSIAGKEVYPNGNVYCSTKHAVDALTQGMRIDLNAHGIRVGAINPGRVETEFSTVRFKGDTEQAAKVYEGFQPLTAQDIAELIHFAITRPSHVNIADLLVLPTAQANATVLHKDFFDATKRFKSCKDAAF